MSVSASDLAMLPRVVINMFLTNPLNSMVESQMLQVVLFFRDFWYCPAYD